MFHLFRLLPTLALAMFLGASLGCTASIGDMGDGPGGNIGGAGPGGEFPEADEEDPLCASASDGSAGSQCSVAADCEPPLVCLDGACVGPRNPDSSCSIVEGTGCDGANEVCVANVCVQNPGSCSVHDDCPLGYLCDGSGQCQPDRDGEACADPGPGPNLTGTYALNSTLHLRDGLPGVVDGILDVSEDLRDIVNGDIDLGLPSAVEFVIGGIVAGIIRSYVPPYAINLVEALGDMSDMLDTMTIEGTLQIQGQACSGTYRIKEEWQWISFTFRGQELRFRPDNLPGVPGGSSLEPDEYQALYSCGVLYLDRHRVQDTMAGLIRFLVDTVVEAATGYPNLETALSGFVDCTSIGYALDNQVAGACSFCPSVAGLAAGACQGFVNTAAVKAGQEIDEAAVEMSLIKVKGTAAIAEDGTISDGRWYGSLLGGDFPGEFSLQRN
jgi:hypothetical protein